MGRYITKNSKGEFLAPDERSSGLIACGDVERIEEPEWDGIPEGKALLCAVRNKGFEAVAYADEEVEFQRFRRSQYDGRVYTWLLMDKALAERLAD